MQFKDLPVNETFDFIGGKYPSFFLACQKVSTRLYQDERGHTHRIGSGKALVYHVGRDFPAEKRQA